MFEWDRINRKKDIIIEEEEDNEAENQVCIWKIYRTYFHSIIENKYNGNQIHETDFLSVLALNREHIYTWLIININIIKEWLLKKNWLFLFSDYLNTFLRNNIITKI